MSINNNPSINQPVFEDLGDNDTMLTTEQLYPDDLEFIKTLYPSKSSSITRTSTGEGVISIINSQKNGKRLALSDQLLSKLNYPSTIQVSFTESELVIGESIPKCTNSYNINTSGKKGLVYATALVLEICDTFNLDFSNRTSMTFDQVIYQKIGEISIARITIDI